MMLKGNKNRDGSRSSVLSNPKKNARYNRVKSRFREGIGKMWGSFKSYSKASILSWDGYKSKLENSFSTSGKLIINIFSKITTH